MLRDHPQNRGRGLRADIRRSGRHRFDASTPEYERGDDAGGVRSGDPYPRTLLALIGDDGGRRTGHVDAAAAVEGFGGRLDLVEQFVGVSVELSGADREFHGPVLDGRGRRVLTGQRGLTGAETGSDAPAGLRNERHVAFELQNVARFDNVVVGHCRVDDGQHHRHHEGQREHRQRRADGAPIQTKPSLVGGHPAFVGFESWWWRPRRPRRFRDPAYPVQPFYLWRRRLSGVRGSRVTTARTRDIKIGDIRDFGAARATNS